MIRTATPEDVAAIAALHGDVFTPGWGAPFWEAAIPQHNTQVLVYGDDVAGLIAVQCSADEAEILTLCVAAHERQNRIGSKLVSSMTDLLRREGTTRLFLDVARNNTAARRLYERHQFIEQGVRPRYYADGEDAITLARDLACADDRRSARDGP